MPSWSINLDQYWYYLMLLPKKINLFKVHYRNKTKRCNIYSKLKIKTPERRHWRRSSVVNFEHISDLFLVFTLLLWTGNSLLGPSKVNSSHKIAWFIAKNTRKALGNALPLLSLLTWNIHTKKTKVKSFPFDKWVPPQVSGVSDKQKTLKMNKIVQISIFSKHIQKLTYFIPMFQFILTNRFLYDCYQKMQSV